MSRMVGGTFGVAAVGALFQHLSDNRLERRLGDLPLSAQQQAWFTDNLGSGDVASRLQQLDPRDGAARSSARCKDAFVHSLSASLKLSTAVAAVGVVIALADRCAAAARPAHARSRAPSRRVAHRPD